MSSDSVISRCPRCRQSVLTLPGQHGTGLYDEVPHDVAEVRERMVWLGSVGVVPLPSTWPRPVTVLRVHQCAQPLTPRIEHTNDDQIDSPRSPVSDPVPALRSVPMASRSDFTALHRLETEATLYRAQETGRLRPHPGQRIYEPVTVTAWLASIGHIQPTRCLLCRRPVDDNTALAVGSIRTDPATMIHICCPECARCRPDERR